MPEATTESETGAGSSGARRKALITGASAGIGACFAERLARDQYDLILVARRRDRLEEIAARLRGQRGVGVEVMAEDLTREASLRTVAEFAAADRALDLLVNNAGFGTAGPFAHSDFEREEEQIRLNILALFRLTRAVLPAMLSRGRGGIIHVSSLAGFVPGPYMATYNATKAFVNSFGDSLYEELRGTGVRCVTLCPGFTRTEFQATAGVDTSLAPGFLWMDPEPVVDAALAGLQRGDSSVIPGLRNQLLSGLVRATPRSWVRRVYGHSIRRAHNWSS